MYDPFPPFHLPVLLTPKTPYSHTSAAPQKAWDGARNTHTATPVYDGRAAAVQVLHRRRELPQPPQPIHTRRRPRQAPGRLLAALAQQVLERAALRANQKRSLCPLRPPARCQKVSLGGKEVHSPQSEPLPQQPSLYPASSPARGRWALCAHKQGLRLNRGAAGAQHFAHTITGAQCLNRGTTREAGGQGGADPPPAPLCLG